MKIFSLGSLNLDLVYSVSHINLEGETIPARELELKHGGKGLNQTVALGRAGAEVMMAGCVGTDGQPLIETLRQAGADTRFVQMLEERSGHAIIQLADTGANAIIIYGGANQHVTPALVDEALKDFSAGDYMLLQNETSSVEYAIRAAKQCGMKVVLNPSPMTAELLQYPLELVDLFILNEIEGQFLSGQQNGTEYSDILQALAKRFPKASIVLTLGERGAMYHDANHDLKCAAYRVPVVDTTGAGDTFCGYFLASIIKGLAPEQALHIASKASALAIGKKGAALSIPLLAEVENAQLE